MEKDKPILTDEEREKLLAEDALRRNRRARYYGKLTQTSSQYEKAAIVRGRTFGQIVSERMLRGEGGMSSIKGAIGEKIGSVGMGIKEKFDPLRLLNKVPVLGGALATMYGMKRGRSAADISYFTGAGRFLKQQPTPGELGNVPGQGGDTGMASKIKSSLKIEGASGVPQKNINNIKTPLAAIKKLYALERMWYDEEKKSREELKRDREVAQNFREEQEMERHRELIKSLTGKDSKIKKKDKDKTKEESKGFFGGLLDLFKNFVGFKLLNGLFSVMGRGLMGLLSGAMSLLTTALAPILPILGAFAVGIAGIVAVTKGLDWLISKFTGKNADYFKMKLDEETTPEDVKKIIKDPNRLRDAQSEKQYEINKKIVETGKGPFGQKLGEKEIEGAKKRIEDYEKLKSFKESDDPLMSYKRDMKEGKISGKTSYSEYKSTMSGDGRSAMEFFQGRGWSAEQAAGIVSNLKSESNLNPSAVGDGGKAYGIAQWHPDRQAQFEKVYGKPITESSLAEQLEFVDWELKNTEARAGNKLKNAKTAAEAGSIVSQDYERPADKLGEASKRAELATQLASSTASPIPQADALSNRMNVAVSENKTLTSNQQQAMPPIMVNTTNNVMGKGGQSVAMAGPTPVRNDEPMLLRSQYGMVKSV